MRKLFLVLLLLLFPAISWADEYVLVMSKEDNVCQHMLKIYNEDLKKYGEVKYDEHEEFNWIKWEGKTFKLRLSDGTAEIHNTRVAVFDINNDSKDEVIIYTEHKKALHHGVAWYSYDIMNSDILGIINKDGIMDRALYYSKRLEHLYSDYNEPVDIDDISKEDIKKLPEEMKKYLVERNELGRRDVYFISPGNNRNFLKVKGRFYSYIIEGASDEDYNESFGRYSIISELQKDNTFKNQCLYLIEKDKQTKRRTK